MPQIACPHCGGNTPVGDVYSGQRVRCELCGGILVLDVQAPKAPRPRPPKLEPLYRPAPPEPLEERARRILASWLDLTPGEIQSALERIAAGDAYHSWEVPKPVGGKRKITAPNEALKLIQRRILDRFLYRIPVSNAAHGFVTGRSIVTNARHHLDGASELLNYDLKDAFPSVKRDRVRHLFVRHVKVPLKHLGENADQATANRIVDYLVELTTHEGALPQGAPTSGYLLNIACTRMDKYIYKFLSEFDYRMRYTRYADDLTISGPLEIPRVVARNVQKIIRHCGYELNMAKARHLSAARGQRLEVTGLILEQGAVRIPRKRLDAYRAAIHQAAQAESLSDEQRLEVQSVVAFVKMVYPRLPSRIAVPYTAFLEKHGLKAAGSGPRMGLELYPDGQQPGGQKPAGDQPTGGGTPAGDLPDDSALIP